MRRFARYCWRLWDHKRRVGRIGRRLGVPWWRVVLHDWSKVLPDEWSAYAAHADGATPDDSLWQAVLRHQRRHDHHWQSAVLSDDDGTCIVLPMPEGAAREMVADWMATAEAKGTSALRWYEDRRAVIHLHADTRAVVESLLSRGSDSSTAIRRD